MQAFKEINKHVDKNANGKQSVKRNDWEEFPARIKSKKQARRFRKK